MIARKTRTVITKSDDLFDKEVREIWGLRQSRRMDKRRPGSPWGRPLIERKIVRHKFWPQIKSDLKIADFLDEKDGFMNATFNWFTIMIVAFVAILFFAGLIYVMGLLNGVINQAGASNEQIASSSSCFQGMNSSACYSGTYGTCAWTGVECVPPGYTNMTYAGQVTFGAVNNSIQNLRLVALTLIFSMIIGTIIVNFLMKVHPVFFFVYILIIVLAILLSAPISNAYYTIRTSGAFGGLLPTFTGTDFIMLNLPIFVTVGGILGGVFLFINIIRTSGEGSLT